MSGRPDWTAKHSVATRLYEISCPECELTYELEAAMLEEIYCPLCSHDEPIRAKEVKPNGGVQMAQ